METPILKEQHVYPDAKVLKNALGESYTVYEELMKTITDTRYALVADWNYYKDGKAWLCKVNYKKKTVFWLSVWDKYFKTGFYFTEKSLTGISELNINEKIKDDFAVGKPVGKLLPLTIKVENQNQINDILKVIEYKKSLK
jgi:hypothetical protein